MAFGFRKKKDNVLDLSKKYKREQIEKHVDLASNEFKKEDVPASPFTFFDNNSSSQIDSSQENGEYVDYSTAGNEKKKRLAKRILDMTNKLEDLSNQIYHLQQRVEVLERKSDRSY